jgi:twinkle protein
VALMLESTLAKIGEMLLLDTDMPKDDPARILADVQAFDGKQLVEAYVRRHSKFGTVPFDPTGDRLRLYPGGVTIWSGFPGAGKTTLLRQLICHVLARGSSAFLASLEEDPENVLVNLAAVAAGCEMPNAHQMQWFIDAYGMRFRLWGKIGIADSEELLCAIRGLADFGIKHAIIDSLMCLDVANDDFEAQRRFANRVAAVARSGRIHVHLVAHPRKLVSADQELDINDVAGARELGGIADNVVFIRRSKDEGPTGMADATPMLISIRKQRHGSGAIGNITGWYHRHLRQFHVEQFPRHAMRYLPEDAYA